MYIHRLLSLDQHFTLWLAHKEGQPKGISPHGTGVDGFSDRAEGICHPFPLLNTVASGCQYTEVLHIWHPVSEPTFNLLNTYIPPTCRH